MANLDLEIQNLRFSVGGTEILHGVNLTLERGAYVGILGPNGSGKSTLLKQVYRLHTPTSGSIKLFGKELSHISIQESAKSIAVVGQFHTVNFDFRVLDMVLMGRTPHLTGLGRLSARDYEIATSALRHTGLTGYEERSFAALSGGEQQRVVLARALTQEPRFLLLDEPTNHLDIHHQIELMELTKSLGISVLAVLHDLNLAAMYCDEIHVMKDGAIIAHGAPADILTEELIESVYDVKARVTVEEGRPLIIYDRA